MIRFAQAQDHPRLKALWMEVFGDSREAVDAYFSLRHADENMLVDTGQGEIAGMLSMLPVTLCTGGGQTYPARYIYAVATDIRFRNRGISTALLEAAHRHMQSLGEAASVLAPASPSLFDFYGKRGYRTVFSLDIFTINAAELPPPPPHGAAAACSAQAYVDIRDRAFSGNSLYVRWDEPAVAYAMRVFAQTGGMAMVTWDGGEGCAAWEKAEDGVVVKELALARGDVQTALSVLHGRLQTNRYTVRLMRGTVPDTLPTPFGMIRWLIPEPALAGKPPYLSLAMD